MGEYIYYNNVNVYDIKLVFIISVQIVPEYLGTTFECNNTLGITLYTSILLLNYHFQRNLSTNATRSPNLIAETTRPAAYVSL